MKPRILSVEIRKKRAGLLLQGIGRTPRGQKFLIAEEALKEKSSKEKDFKGDVKTAVKKMFDAQSDTPE